MALPNYLIFTTRNKQLSIFTVQWPVLAMQ